mmetsp:Transcript_17481/g.25278  ORF Transcript_17481/g.25278 Transcript_17481/m.25278 type:complete len:203 (+) Transcript_17481:160-768(+)
MSNICGLTRGELDAHRAWVTHEGRCIALKPDGEACNRPYSAHSSSPVSSAQPAGPTMKPHHQSNLENNDAMRTTVFAPNVSEDTKGMFSPERYVTASEVYARIQESRAEIIEEISVRRIAHLRNSKVMRDVLVQRNDGDTFTCEVCQNVVNSAFNCGHCSKSLCSGCFSQYMAERITGTVTYECPFCRQIFYSFPVIIPRNS